MQFYSFILGHIAPFPYFPFLSGFLAVVNLSSRPFSLLVLKSYATCIRCIGKEFSVNVRLPIFAYDDLPNINFMKLNFLLTRALN